VTSDDQIGQLLRLAGRRAMPDPRDMRQARAAAHAEWTSVVRQRSRRLRWRSLVGGAIAAASCAAAVWVWTLPHTASPLPVEIAAFQRITDSVVITSAGMAQRRIRAANTPLRAGDRIEVPADGRAAFVLTGGIGVRLDRDTAATLRAADRLVLHQGAVYIDSARAHTGKTADGPGLRVETPFAAVRHLGTKFEVRVGGGSVRVRVREGAVALERDSGRWVGNAGEALTLAQGRAVQRQGIATSGAEWAWVASLAEPFHLDGASVQAFLDWVSREDGCRWQIDDPALRARADRIVLHGSIDGLTPAEALEAVLPASGLTFRRDGDRLIVSAAAHSRPPRSPDR
jgi:ferric-dicitrate binding protein FerR (iron transport regulator)